MWENARRRVKIQLVEFFDQLKSEVYEMRTLCVLKFQLNFTPPQGLHGYRSFV